MKIDYPGDEETSQYVMMNTLRKKSKKTKTKSKRKKKDCGCDK